MTQPLGSVGVAAAVVLVVVAAELAAVVADLEAEAAWRGPAVVVGSGAVAEWLVPLAVGAWRDPVVVARGLRLAALRR